MKNTTIASLMILASLWLPAGSNTYAGKYEDNTNYTEATFKITELKDGKYSIQGISLFGITNEYGPNIGELDFVATMKKNTIVYKEGEYILTLQFSDGMIIAKETGGKHFDFGMNVSFDGKYKKVVKVK